MRRPCRRGSYGQPHTGANGTAHAGAHPLGCFNAKFVEQVCRQARIKRKAVFL